MNKLHRKRQSMSVWLLGIIMVVCICLMNSVTEQGIEDYYMLASGWNIQVNHTDYANVDLGEFRMDAARKGDYISMQTRLPQKKISNPVLRIYTIHSEVSVELDSQEIYHYGRELNAQNRLVGYGYHFIDLPDDYMGKNLTIQLWVTENNAFTYLETPQIDNELTEMRNYIMQKKVPLAVNLFLIVFGICLLMSSVLFVGRNIKFGQLICVAGFSIGIGCWSLCNYDLIILFTYDMRLKVLMEFISLYVTPVFVLLYFWTDATEKRNKAYRIAYYMAVFCQSMLAVLSIIFQAANLVHLPEMLKYEHILLVLIFSGIIGVAIYDLKNHNIHNQALMLGIGIMIVIGLTDIFRFNMDKFNIARHTGRYTSNLCIGALVYVLAQIIDFSTQISKKLYESAQRDILEKMAYTDELTGIANRRRCEEEWDRIEQNDNYGILAFDLNHLKKMNDTYGHESGDKLIRSFAECIQSAFGRHATVGRMGGDEFIVIFEDMTGIDIEEQLESYKKELAKCNKANPDLHISAAYGFCSKAEEPGLEAKEIYRKADGRMYECKVAMKCQRTKE